MDARLVACHRIPSRSFFVRGRQLPVCARCTGILAGYLAYPALLAGLLSIGWWTALAMNVPALLDGGSQAAGWRESSNGLRLATGVLSGVGQVSILVLFSRWAADVLVRAFL